MRELEIVKVLLVDDDEDDYVLTRILFTEMRGHKFELEWAANFQLGLEAMARNQHDVCLIDYHLGARTGIELLRAALAAGCQSPIILLTGLGEHDVDVAAMNAGAADYLVKTALRPDSLERAIRYALERKRAAAGSAFEQAGLAALGTDMANILTRPEPLGEILRQCADSLFRHLNVHLVQIWLLDPRDNLLRVSATAGAVSELDSGETGQVELESGQYAPADGRPILINDEMADDRIPCREWVKREETTSYLGYPLLIEERIIGLITVFSHVTITQSVVQQMDAVVSGIALCIDRKQAETQVQKLLAFPNADPHPVVEFDADGSLVYANDATRQLATALEVEEAEAILPANAAEIVRQVLADAEAKLGQEVPVNGKTISWSFIPITDSQAVFGYGVEVPGGSTGAGNTRPAKAAKGETEGPSARETARELDRIIAALRQCAEPVGKSAGRKTPISEDRNLGPVLDDLAALRSKFGPPAPTPAPGTASAPAAKKPAPKAKEAVKPASRKATAPAVTRSRK